MKNFRQTIRHYYLFSAALVGSAIALPLDIAGFHSPAHWILIGVSVAELIPLIIGMIKDLTRGTYGVDILAATAIGTSVLLGEYWAGMVIVLMLTGGEALEDYAGHRAERELDALLTRAPRKARVLRGRKEIEVKVSEVAKGDKIVIRPGDLVPVDAVVIEGTASFDESSLTGESLPQAKDEGDELLSGAVDMDGPVIARALRSAEDSQYEQIIKLVRAAQASQAPFVRLADRYAVPFTIVSFAIAIAAWVTSGDSIRFLEVIVVATPCPLILAAPIAIISGMSRAAKHGIIIKTGASLEQLAGARTVGFDKTGTLTKGILRVEKVTTYNSFNQNDVLGMAASLERHSNHVQATAINGYAQKKKTKSVTLKRVQEVAGKGMVGFAKDKQIIVGRLKLLEEHEVALPRDFKVGDHDRTAAFVAIGGKLAGVITFADEIREESKHTLDELKRLGIEEILMVSGDNRKTAAAIAKQLGISRAIGEALPGDKIRAVETSKIRPVAFVGDGVNDAPVLAASDVGVALGARGSAAASESADVVIMLDDLSRVSKAIEIAKHAFTIARQSIWIGIGMSVGLMLIFSTGRFLPIYGAAIQEVVDVVVIFNALRAHGSFKKRPV